MLFTEIVATSELVARAAGRLEKTSRLADCIRRPAPQEVAIAINYLSGMLRQGRIGIGLAKLLHLRRDAAATPSLSLSQVDQVFGMLAAEGKAAPGSDDIGAPTAFQG